VSRLYVYSVIKGAILYVCMYVCICICISGKGRWQPDSDSKDAGI
jgi:hypothetical protein